MKKYCAFLRGVNVNGTSMKMKEVCDVFTKAGMFRVQSILASGNILFESDKNESDLKSILEEAMSKTFNYEAFLFIRDFKSIENVLMKKAFEDKEDCHHYVFISDKNTAEKLQQYFEEKGNKEYESAKMVDAVFYWQTPKGNTLNSEFGKVLGMKNLKDKFTSRNLNTIEKIVNKLK
ncbi:DUF1697 domain-containing protein [Soonwooa purpurea]